jgi:Acyl-CoA dehydrogenase, C-terminal domain
VRFVNDATGASSIGLEQPFERHFRDAHGLAEFLAAPWLWWLRFF